VSFRADRLTEKATSGAGEEWPREGNGQELGGKGRVSPFVSSFLPKRGGPTPGLCGGYRNGRGGRVMAAEMVDDGEMGEGLSRGVLLGQREKEPQKKK